MAAVSSSYSLTTLEQKLISDNGDLRRLTAAEQFAVLERHADTIIEKSELKRLLSESKRTKKPLRIKLGIDPTAADLHFGHAVQLLLVGRLQRMGHKIILIIGDFTATIGDPAGRVLERPVLSSIEVASNIRSFKKQAALFINVNKAEIRRNSEWLSKMSLDDFFGFLRLQTVATALQREDFRKRASITRAELLYATLQAIDSVQIGADIEIGGKDQLLNVLEGRELMARLDLKPQSVITTPLLPGTSGGKAKMSKSANNYIGVLESADEIYGKALSIPDEQMLTYFEMLTDINLGEISQLKSALANKSIDPKELKKLLARLLVSLAGYTGREALAAEQKFESVFAKKEMPKKVRSLNIARSSKPSLVEILVKAKLSSSKSDAKRLVKGDSVHIVDKGSRRNISALTAKEYQSKSITLQIGKRRFIKILWT